MAFHLLFLSALLALSSGDLFRVDPPCFTQAGALPFPKSYVVYHLAETEKIAVDGHLDETAWSGVPWTDRFIDIQGSEFTRPRFDTMAKMRWDDEYLYVGAYMQETDVFANQTEHNSVVFYDNDFEVFTNPNGSTHMYKELEINAINTTWDLELNKPYMNGGSPNSSWEMPTMKSATFVDGPINNPLIKNHFWTVEMALPLKDLAKDATNINVPPKEGDQWRINFSRVEWHVKNVGRHYEKVPNVPEDNWVWSSQYSINMHLPERWGFIQFTKNSVNSTTFQLPSFWPVYVALVAVYDAEKIFYATNGYFTGNLTALDVPQFVFDGKCSGVPVINAGPTSYSFEIAVHPRHPDDLVGHIRTD
ncbi:uncharacterized protein, partial [Oscarella lobularis]|uniref:uncharacterized protein n=1 Tax=Oscarella lobularis TaxID=121494 RepID=UPI003313D123